VTQENKNRSNKNRMNTEDRMETLNFGIIGAGLMGKRRAASIKAMPDTKILLIADTDLARAEELAMAHDCDATTDAQKVLAHPDIDCVVICTTTPMLATLTIDALGHGKHVLVEKPLAMTLADARAVVAAGKSAKDNPKNRIVKVGFNHESEGALRERRDRQSHVHQGDVRPERPHRIREGVARA
jgi:predicted dehydrogenase